MTTCKPASGGIATQNMAPLDEVILRVIVPPMRECYRNLVLEQKAHRDTLLIFQAVVAGEIPVDAIVVNIDGWQMKAERPLSQVTGGGWENGVYTGSLEELGHRLFMCSGCGKEISPQEAYQTNPGVYYHEACRPPTINGVEPNDDGTYDALKNLEAAS